MTVNGDETYYDDVNDMDCYNIDEKSYGMAL